MSKFHQTTIMTITATGVWLNMLINVKREFEKDIKKTPTKCQRDQK